jgi:mannose-6-phosphate isomerase
MTAPQPVVCQPLFKEKPWGSQRLAELLDKELPGDTPIGESWELVSLPENESRVKRGPLEGKLLSELVEAWGADLTGSARLIDERFPLLIKFLDAQDHLSVQVHPKPQADDPEGWAPGIKHEAWYVVAADPGSEMFIGLKPGTSREQVAAAANTPKFANLLRRLPAKPGDCFYLPSGTMHALGKGLVVAEVQTPSDITYRIYDWGRMGLDGKPRELHIDESLNNTRYDVKEHELTQLPTPVHGSFMQMTRKAECQRFTMDKASFPNGSTLDVRSPDGDEMLIWMVLSGAGDLQLEGNRCHFEKGDTVLIPAKHSGLRLEVTAGGELLEVRIPTAQ